MAEEQLYGDNPIAQRQTDQYKREYVHSFVRKWDELIDWDARAASEGDFFINILKERGVERVLDVATGTGFHSRSTPEGRLRRHQRRRQPRNAGSSLRERQTARLHHEDPSCRLAVVEQGCSSTQYDAVICLGNSLTHLFSEQDRRKALAEFYSVLHHDGVLVLDQRNYDDILDDGFTSKHIYYYCGDNVSAEPEYVDEGLARFRYEFPDSSVFHLNMFPLRKDYVRKAHGRSRIPAGENLCGFPGIAPRRRPGLLHPRSREALQERGTARQDGRGGQLLPGRRDGAGLLQQQ